MQKPHDWKSTSTFEGPSQSIGFLFWQTFLQWQRECDVLLAPYNLTQPGFSILAIAAWLGREQDGVRQKQIANVAGIQKMHLSQILNRLIGKGFLETQISEQDRRENIIYLTPLGLETLKSTITLVEAKDREMLGEDPHFVLLISRENLR